MGVLKYLPAFSQIEPDNLLGLTMGHVVAQLPVAYAEGAYGVKTVSKNGYPFIENGVICEINAQGKIADAKADSKNLFIHFTEELNTVLEGRKYFAVEAEGTETYLRLVALVPGSEWTTNVGDGSDKDVYDALIAAGRIIVTNENATLPNGDIAKSYLCIA